jgi:hypothetical protein|tara:strand:- start:259 stop:495 length:237 start_codon:yes stop_codon:yes gene_type:complete
MKNKIFYYFLYFVSDISTKLSSWSWSKLYSDRSKGYGYTFEKLRYDRSCKNFTPTVYNQWLALFRKDWEEKNEKKRKR